MISSSVSAVESRSDRDRADAGGVEGSHGIDGASAFRRCAAGHLEHQFFVDSPSVLPRVVARARFAAERMRRDVYYRTSYRHV
jgi:hypothetical protein